jgi:hypothetical protein
MAQKMAQKGKMKVGLKTEKGITVTDEKGFTVEEIDGKVLAFDVADHPELGTALLFGNQIFALKFWDDEDLEKGLRIFTQAIQTEMERRKKT